jgi:hypothetical protein
MMQLSVHHNPLLDRVPTKPLAHIGYFTSIYKLIFLGYLQVFWDHQFNPWILIETIHSSCSASNLTKKTIHIMYTTQTLSIP